MDEIAMTQFITIQGDTLITPDGTIEGCWEDRAARLLSRSAGVALMPYINAQERLERDYERLMESMEYGDPALPPHPEALYVYTVDGDEAWPSKEVRRDECAAVWMNDGEPTGRIYMSTLSDTKRLLGIE